MVLPTTSPRDSVESRQTLREKLAAVAGTGAVAVAAVSGAPSEVRGGPVLWSLNPPSPQSTLHRSTTTPIATPSSDGSNFWDVDGDGTPDFKLELNGTSSYSYARFNDSNGGRLVVPADQTQNGIAKLPFDLTIGPGFAAAYKFHTSPQRDNTIWTRDESAIYTGGPADDGGWQLGDTGFFGFKFTKGSDTHYGWGEMTISNSYAWSGFTINEAWYENSAGASVGVGAIPEASQVAGLSLLALGAAGLAIWRRRKESVDAVVE